jgi:RNA polymerase sigma-70 factor (ECF subfamily)
MEDSQIIDLFFQRSEHSINALHTKYYRFCYSVIMKIITDSRDIEECINDTFLRTWNSIPPNRPECLPAYLATIARNIAIDKYSYNTAGMRNSALTVAYDELEPFLPAYDNTDNNIVNEQHFKEFMNNFLRNQSKEARVFFVRRYWYGDSIKEIATECKVREEKVKTSLFRTRNKLKASMLKEGLFHEYK